MPNTRSIPSPIMVALKKQFPRLLAGDIEGEDVYLLMADDKGEPFEGVRYIASPEFLTAVRVYDSGIDNFLMLVGKPGGFKMPLLAPED
jgi:hypothetical protein